MGSRYTWTNAGLLSTGPLGTNFSEMRIEIQKFHSLKLMGSRYTWTNAGLLSTGPLGTNFSEMQIEIQKFHSLKGYGFKKIREYSFKSKLIRIHFIQFSFLHRNFVRYADNWNKENPLHKCPNMIYYNMVLHVTCQCQV